MKKITIENAIYMWFNMKYELYSRMDYGNFIYVYDGGDEYADIVIDKKYDQIYYSWRFWEGFYEVFLIELDEFKQVLPNWVEDTFDLKGFTPRYTRVGLMMELKLPK